jgi:ATP-dependent helicase/nuclease subunit A
MGSALNRTTISMTDTSSKIKSLKGAQLQAVNPQDNVWLSASAGTGKTQVLSARVVRLLMQERVSPENLLCITFTKAAAAEMAGRINLLLASWVQMKGSELADHLKAIGSEFSPAAQDRARQLFASVLDAPGGGLQIMTIHSLCQSLLATFPEEAGLIPGFKPVDGREQDELHREALAEMIIEAEERDDQRLLDSLRDLSLDLSEEPAVDFLKQCAKHASAMQMVPKDDKNNVLARRLVGVEYEGSIADMLRGALDDSVIDRSAITAVADMNRDWGKGKPDSRGEKRATALYEWLASPITKRAENFEQFHRHWANDKGEPMVSSRGYTPTDAAYSELALGLYNWTSELKQSAALIQYADRLGGALYAGSVYTSHYQARKKALAVVDFDDMISQTAALLNTSGMAQWVRYKLDRQIDHILIDEAQDTNRDQWSIIKALSDDFFSGLAGKPELPRTIFAVGDYKQAIFGFQGTDPERYAEARDEYKDKIASSGGTLQELYLSKSFRSTRPILDYVNAVIDVAGSESFGIAEAIEPHYSEISDIGSVTLFEPVTTDSEDEDDGEYEDQDQNEEREWLTSDKRKLAGNIAGYVAQLVRAKPFLASEGRHLLPGDILLLLRSRTEMASLLVAQLHERNVPVAGLDRLRLLQPIAVQDLIAAINFVLQPDDDYSLACLMVSPLIGWDHDKLLEYGYREQGVPLWKHLRSQPAIEADIEPLKALLKGADFSTSYLFLERILSGPMAGRSKFTQRLGAETLVPIEEMLNAALIFEQRHGGGLQSFLDWFERGNTDIKRDAVPGSDEVRIMTVHGAKGLQAPVVIVCDVTADPDKKKNRSSSADIGEITMPLLPIRKADRVGRLAQFYDTQKTKDANEHNRLLYVALTRAQEHLVLAGSLTASRKGEAPKNSWYTVLQQSMEELGCDWQDHADFGKAMCFAKSGPDSIAEMQASREIETPISLPQWISALAPAERRPPKPLVPSQLGDDDHGDAPPSPAMRFAAEKGRLIHAVFERLSGDNPSQMLALAQRWLARNNLDPAISNSNILDAIEPVLANEEWRVFFGPEARAEVPLAAVVGEAVITGRIDRLLISGDRVHALDFKTGYKVPNAPDQISAAYIRQMAHYVAALECIFPKASVSASLLYTSGPAWFELSGDMLAPHKPR